MHKGGHNTTLVGGGAFGVAFSSKEKTKSTSHIQNPRPPKCNWGVWVYIVTFLNSYGDTPNFYFFFLWWANHRFQSQKKKKLLFSRSHKVVCFETWSSDMKRYCWIEQIIGVYRKVPLKSRQSSNWHLEHIHSRIRHDDEFPK
jgi:hypothetical protein